MTKILYSENMIICMLILAVIYYNDVKTTRGPLMIGQKVFRTLLIANMIAMFFDVFSVICDGTDFWYSRILVETGVFFYYFFHSMVGSLFLLYVDFSLYPDRKRFKKRFSYYVLPSVIMMITNVISIWTGWYFKVNEQNSYERGPLFILPIIVNFLYVIFSIGLILNWWSCNKADYKRHKELCVRLIIVPIIPCIGAVIQALIPGSASTLPCTALALLMNYITVQNGQMAKDHLTGLYNRGQLESFMNYQIRNLRLGKYFFLILLDLDKFKQINDTYGHIVGDDALIQMANILRSNCKRKEDYVSRLGGDEFVIIGQCMDKASVEKIVERLHNAVEDFNRTSGKVYKLEFSAGYTICHQDSEATLDTLINEADEKMYQAKKEKKLREKMKEQA